MNLLAASGAFVIFGIYLTFLQWGADGWLYWIELVSLAVAVIMLFVCAGSFWWRRRSRLFTMLAQASSLIILVFAGLVFFPTIHSRRGTAGFTENMIWLTVPMIFSYPELSAFNDQILATYSNVSGAHLQMIAMGTESIPKGLKPHSFAWTERPEAEASGYLQASTGNSNGNGEIQGSFTSFRMTWSSKGEEVEMSDRATPNLPSRDFEATFRFYGLLGFEESWRDKGWMILRRGELQLEFFLYPGIDPFASSFGCCLRLDELDGFYGECLKAGLLERETGIPRLGAPKMQPFGLRMGFLVDLDGTLLSLIQNLEG